MKNTWLIKILCIVITIFVASCWTSKDVETWPGTLQIWDNTLTSEWNVITNAVPQTAEEWSTVVVESSVQFKQ